VPYIHGTPLLPDGAPTARGVPPCLDDVLFPHVIPLTFMQNLLLLLAVESAPVIGNFDALRISRVDISSSMAFQQPPLNGAIFSFNKETLKYGENRRRLRGRHCQSTPPL
jgi:hypothetical protein